MKQHNNGYEQWVDDDTAEAVGEEAKAISERIYRSHLPPYLQDSWPKGKGKWYEDWLKEQLHILVMDEIIDDPARLEELKRLEPFLALVFGVFGAAFRILDLVGLHLRAQTLGQYEVLPEDESLLRELCRAFLQEKQAILNPFFGLP
jgi:hypothetical protein